MDTNILDNLIGSHLKQLEAQTHEFEYLYSTVEDSNLKLLFSTLHAQLTNEFNHMNERLPTNEETAHFWAVNSRNLLSAIEIIKKLERQLNDSTEAFTLDSYYDDRLAWCKRFLSPSGGSEIPSSSPKIVIYEEKPIFIKELSTQVLRGDTAHSYPLQLIGEGSYAHVYSYRDTYYDKKFVLKKGKSSLDTKERERFKQEFEVMKKLSSPYILEVFAYDAEKMFYVMEYMDYTLDSYLNKYHSQLPLKNRKNIIYQILSGFEYLHSKDILHRDISPKNILLRKYEDGVIVKISDFGLVKLAESDLTSENTEMKGCLNDPALRTEGFANYTILHETYALTSLLTYILTGKTNFSKINDKNLKNFIGIGMSSDKTKRFQNINEIKSKLDTFL